MRMGLRLHGTGFGAAEQFVGGDRPLSHLQVLLRIVGDALSQLVGMRQKKVNVEGACLIEQAASGIQGGSFVCIGSSLVSLAQVKQQFGGARGLAHRVVLLSHEQTFLVPPVYSSSTLLSSLFEGRLN